jgi:TPR repeat protein
MVGLCLAFGRGVAQDRVEAYAWCALAATSVESALKLRDQIGREMTPEQVLAAYRRTKELRVEIETKLKRSGSKYIPSETILVKPDLKR